MARHCASAEPDDKGNQRILMVLWLFIRYFVDKVFILDWFSLFGNIRYIFHINNYRQDKNISDNFLARYNLKIKADKWQRLHPPSFISVTSVLMSDSAYLSLLVGLLTTRHGMSLYRSDVARCSYNDDRMSWSDIWRVYCLLGWPTEQTSADPWLQVLLISCPTYRRILFVRLAICIERRLTKYFSFWCLYL